MEDLLKLFFSALIKAIDEDYNDVNSKNNLENNNLESIKNIFKQGTYKSKAYDYNNKKNGAGVVKIIHNNNNIELEHILNIIDRMDCDKKHLAPNHQHQLKRTGAIKSDSYKKIFYDQETLCAKYIEGISSQSKYAIKHMELDSISDLEAVFIGYGSSHSTKKQHPNPTIKKIVTKEKNNDSFFVKTYFEEKLTYECAYEKQ
jgi:hypothetical protein